MMAATATGATVVVSGGVVVALDGGENGREVRGVGLRGRGGTDSLHLRTGGASVTVTR